MKAVEVRNGIYWVGAVDWAIRDFHGYETPRGTSYNNYLVVDEEPTLVDTVKHDFADVTLKNIRDIIDPGRIRHVIINHIENDHATSVDRVMAACPGATLYMTERGKKGLARFFDLSGWRIKTVKTGDTLKIGQKTILFLETPMLHWPDSMVSYVQEDKVLFSQDAFGQHIGSSARFDDEFIACESVAELEDAVLDYYANILMPFGPLIKTKIAEVMKLGLDLQIIAPDHGIIWRQDPGKIVRMYLDMAEGKATRSVAVIYDTMWHSTEQMTQSHRQGHQGRGAGMQGDQAQGHAHERCGKGILAGEGHPHRLADPQQHPFSHHRPVPHLSEGTQGQEPDRRGLWQLWMGRRGCQRSLRDRQADRPGGL